MATEKPYKPEAGMGKGVGTLRKKLKRTHTRGARDEAGLSFPCSQRQHSRSSLGCEKWILLL